MSWFCQRYWTLKGRFGRADMWAALSIMSLIAIAGLFLLVPVIAFKDNRPLEGIAAAVSGISWLALFVLGTAVHVTSVVKRLHDFGRSGWYYLLVMLLTAIGGIALPAAAELIQLAIFVVFHCIPGSYGPNPYGPDPRATSYSGELAQWG